MCGGIALCSDQNFSIGVEDIKIVSTYSISLRERDVEESGILVRILRGFGGNDLGMRWTLCCV